MVETRAAKAVFKIIDAHDHPHGGRILRLRLLKGEAPAVKELRGASMLCTSPSGDQETVTIEGFAVFGGRPTDARFARTGRIDIHVPAEGEDEAGPSGVEAGWEAVGPLAE